jgi:hypothetical protein
MQVAGTLPVIQPSHWPSRPSPWSFSVLKGIEDCPRRWALSAAAYPEIWDFTGYPPLMNVKALAGQVIHEAIKKISAALMDAGCGSMRESAAVPILRDIGGFTNVLNTILERTVGRYRANPRVARVLDRITAELIRDIPMMRQQVQVHLNRLTFGPRRSSYPSTSGSAARGPLGEGSHSELKLQSMDLDWVGIVDLLQINDGQCWIREFKSGSADERHREQLHAYTLLWADDKLRNPDNIPVGRLVLSYADRWFDITPLSADALAAFRTELRARVAAAAKSVTEDPPVARPGPEKCRFCDVRQLCKEYWDVLQTPGIAGATDDLLGDMEVVVSAQRGPRSWDAAVVRSAWLPRESPIILALSNTGSLAASVIASGMQVRLLNVSRTDQAETEERPLVSITARTEIFTIG